MERVLRSFLNRGGHDVRSICEWINLFGDGIADDDKRQRLKLAAYTTPWYVNTGRASGTLGLAVRDMSRKDAIALIAEVAAEGVTVQEQAEAMRRRDRALNEALVR